MKKLNCKFFLPLLLVTITLVVFSQNSYSQNSMDKNQYRSILIKDYGGKKVHIDKRQPVIEKKADFTKQKTKTVKSSFANQNNLKKGSPDKSIQKRVPQIEFQQTQSFIRVPQQIKSEPVLIGGLMKTEQNETKAITYNTPGKPAFTDDDKTILKAKMGVDHNKKYNGDFSPDAIAYLKTINFPALNDTGNPIQDKINLNDAIELWKKDNSDSIESILLKIDQLNKNYNN